MFKTNIQTTPPPKIIVNQLRIEFIIDDLNLKEKRGFKIFNPSMIQNLGVKKIFKQKTILSKTQKITLDSFT